MTFVPLPVECLSGHIKPLTFFMAWGPSLYLLSMQFNEYNYMLVSHMWLYVVKEFASFWGLGHSVLLIEHVLQINTPARRRLHELLSDKIRRIGNQTNRGSTGLYGASLKFIGHTLHRNIRVTICVKLKHYSAIYSSSSVISIIGCCASGMRKSAMIKSGEHHKAIIGMLFYLYIFVIFFCVSLFHFPHRPKEQSQRCSRVYQINVY